MMHGLLAKLQRSVGPRGFWCELLLEVRGEAAAFEFGTHGVSILPADDMGDGLETYQLHMAGIWVPVRLRSLTQC